MCDVITASCVWSGVLSGLTVAATRPQTFILHVKAVGVAAAAAIPEGRACTDVFVKEPQLDKVVTLGTSISLQLTLGCKQNTHIYNKVQSCRAAEQLRCQLFVCLFVYSLRGVTQNAALRRRISSHHNHGADVTHNAS